MNDYTYVERDFFSSLQLFFFLSLIRVLKEKNSSTKSKKAYEKEKKSKCHRAIEIRAKMEILSPT